MSLPNHPALVRTRLCSSTTATPRASFILPRRRSLSSLPRQATDTIEVQIFPPNKKGHQKWCPFLLAEKRRFSYSATLCIGATNHSAKEQGPSWSLTVSRAKQPTLMKFKSSNQTKKTGKILSFCLAEKRRFELPRRLPDLHP